MSRGYFKVQAKGNIGSDIEMNTLPTGNTVVNFSMAATEAYTNSKGERIENTTWMRVTAYRQTADLLVQLAQKGTELLIDGKLSVSKWQDKNGNSRESTEIIVDSFDVLRRGKERTDINQVSGPNQYQQPPQQNRYQSHANGLRPNYQNQ